MTLLIDLIEHEGWSIRKDAQGKETIIAFDQEYPFTHPALIHLKRYRTEKNPSMRYHHMYAVDRYFWPNIDFHDWTKRRFEAHVEEYNYIVMAAGASASKSFDMARIIIIWWFSNPRERAAIVASTTLESLQARVYGYVTNLISKMKIKIPYQYLGGNTPKILAVANKPGAEIRDSQHGIFAVSAKTGDDERVISSLIGRHPTDALLMALDESTDLSASLMKSLANLDSSDKPFQLWAVGNSNSKFDLHGSLATPKNGWSSVSPLRDSKWETSRKNGICLYFSPYTSPAIHEPNAEKRKRLSKFLITAEQIEEKKLAYGEDSDSFWRFCLGFWRSSSTDCTVMSREFLAAYRLADRVEWSGLHNINYIAGLDVAYSVGGDQCILRLAKMGVATNGKVCLDFMGDALKFKLQISATSGESAEIQIAKQVQKILLQYRIPIQDLCVDCTGQGRAIGGVIQLQMGSLVGPMKMYTVKQGTHKVNSFDCIICTPIEMWTAWREYMMHEQVKGLDYECIQQLSSRLIVKKEDESNLKLESKKAYKSRMAGIRPEMGKSPDEADSAALVLQVAIRNYSFSPGQRKVVAQQLEFHHEKMYNHMMGIKMIEEKHEAPHAVASGFTQVGKAGGSFKKFY